jgi:hypothetical protein
MALATRVVCDKEGNDGDRGKSDGGDVGGQATAMRAMVEAMAMAPTWAMLMAMRLAGNNVARAKGARAMTMAMRVAGNKEGNDGKAMAMATRVAGERTVTAMKRAMSMATREVGKEEENGRDGKEDSNCKQ